MFCTEMYIGIVGSREFQPLELIQYFIAQLKANEVKFKLVSGGARGADQVAQYAYARLYWPSLPVIYNADWDSHGKIAGFIRNKQIAQKSDLVICFWDGHSKGCINTVEHCNELNKPFVVLCDVGIIKVSGDIPETLMKVINLIYCSTSPVISASA